MTGKTFNQDLTFHCEFSMKSKRENVTWNWNHWACEASPDRWEITEKYNPETKTLTSTMKVVS